MSKIPNFAGAEKLSLMDLQALADVVEAQERVLPPAVLPNRLGARKYSLANFNLETANSCDGSAWPDNEGLIRSVAFSVEDEPYICQGDIAIPMAHYVPSGGDDAPSAVGALSSVVVEQGITAPDIQRGQVRLPLADSSCDGSVAGLVQGVQLDSASGAYITAGVLHLPASGGGGDDCCGGCTCVPAQYTPGGTSILGLISSVDPVEDITAAEIVNGAIRLPLADSTVCGGTVAGLVQGVQVDSAATSPYIAAGVLHLAGGDDCCGGCACVPAEYDGSSSTLGLVRSIDGNTSILQPDIVDGAIRLPYADTARGAEGIMQGVSVVGNITDPLLCYGNLYLPLADTCNGATGLITGVALDATEPYIAAGVLHLPLSCGGSCSCEPAQYNNAEVDDVTGLIASVEADETATQMSIADGAIKIPLVDSTLCAGQVTGLVSGLFVSQSAAVLPEPGVDGWSLVLYLPMQSANGGSQIVSYRLLVRFYKGELQFSAQQCLHPNGSWQEYYSA